VHAFQLEAALAVGSLIPDHPWLFVAVESKRACQCPSGESTNVTHRIGQGVEALQATVITITRIILCAELEPEANVGVVVVVKHGGGPSSV
jgi:hypothetical protein